MVKMTWFYAIFSALFNFKISWLSWEHHESSWISQLWLVLITILKITWNEVPLRKPYQGISGYSEIKILFLKNRQKISFVKNRHFSKNDENCDFEKAVKIINFWKVCKNWNLGRILNFLKKWCNSENIYGEYLIV